MEMTRSNRVVALVWRCLIGSAPTYPTELCRPINSTLGTHFLRSAEQSLLYVSFALCCGNCCRSHSLVYSWQWWWWWWWWCPQLDNLDAWWICFNVSWNGIRNFFFLYLTLAFHLKHLIANCKFSSQIKTSNLGWQSRDIGLMYLHYLMVQCVFLHFNFFISSSYQPAVQLRDPRNAIYHSWFWCTHTVTK